MSAIKYNFELNQGETFEMTLQVLDTSRRPIDLTGYLVRSQLRAAYTDADPIVSFTCSLFDAVNGKVRLNLTDEQTAALNFTKGVYDLEIESPTGFVNRVIQGVVTLSREVTR